MIRFLIIVLLLIVASCKPPEARYPVVNKTGAFLQESAQRNKVLNEREYKEIQAIISQSSNIEYIASESGFWYYYNTKLPQETVRATHGDVLNFNYNIKTLKGIEIYSDKDLANQSYIMDKEPLFTGLREGLKLMKAGETVTFLFPSEKAYGYYGDKHKIGANVPIMCRVTLNSIQQTINN